MKLARLHLVLPLLVAPLQAACFASAGLDATKSEPIGSIHLVSAALGDHTLVPAACASGEHQVFLGADFADGQGELVTRLIVDAVGGASIRVFAAAHALDQGLLFHRQDCGTFHLSLERTGWRINDVYDLRVSLEVDCHDADGGSLQGKLAVAHCS